MGDIFDEFAMQMGNEKEEEEATQEPDIFDQLANEMDEEERVVEDEDRGGDLGLPGGDADREPDVKTDKPSPTLEDVPDHIPAQYRQQYLAGMKQGQKPEKTVRQTLVGETEDVPEATLHAGKRAVQGARHGAGSILEGVAGHIEKDITIKELQKQAIIGDLMQRAQKQAAIENPDDPGSVVWGIYRDLVIADKDESAKTVRVVKDIVTAEVEESKFEGGWAKDADAAVAGMAEFFPSMAVTIGTGGVGMAAALPMTYLTLFGDKYEAVGKETGSKERAFKVATIHAALGTPVEYASNIFQIKGVTKLFKMFAAKGSPKAFSKFIAGAKTVVGNAISEAGEEGAQAYTEAYADIYTDAPEGATPEQINAMFLEVIKTEEFIKTRNESAKIGAIGGGLMAGGGVTVASAADLRKAIKAKWAAWRADPNFLKSVKIAKQSDIDEYRRENLNKVSGEQLSADVSNNEKTEAENQGKEQAQEKKDIEAQQDQLAEDQHNQKQAAADQADAQAAEAEKQAQEEQRQYRNDFTESLNDPATLMATAEEVQTKTIREAHKALTIGEDSIKKLEGLSYELRRDVEAREAGFEATTTAVKMANLVDQRVDELKQEEMRVEGDKLADQGFKQEEKELKEAEQLFTKEELADEPTAPKAAKKETSDSRDLFDVFAEDAQDAAIEREEDEKAAEEAKKRTTEKAKTPTTKKAFYSGRSFGRRRAAGISKADSAKMDAAFAEQRRKAAEKQKAKQETRKEPPKDLQAAIELEDGTILKGTSHYEILGNMTDDQIEKVDFANVKRGFTSAESGFLNVDESTKRYGVTKSQQIPTTKKLLRSEKADTPAVFLRTDISEKESRKERDINKEVAGREIKAGNIKVGDVVRMGEFAELNKVLNTRKAGYSRQYGDVKYADKIRSSAQTITAYGKIGKRSFVMVGPAESAKTDGEHYFDPNADATKFKFILPGQYRLMSFQEARGHQLEAFARKEKGKGVTKRLERSRGATHPAGGMDANVAFERLAEVDPKYMEGKKVKLVQSASELNPAIRAEIGNAAAMYHEAPGDKLGEGTIYLVADRTASKLDLMINLWHEMGHVGLAKMAKQLNTPIDDLLKEVKKSYTKDVLWYQNTYDISESDAAEEVLVNVFEVGNDRSIKAKLGRVLRTMANKLGIGFASKTQIEKVVTNMRRVAAGKSIRFGQKGHSEARKSTSEGISTVRKALKPAMIKEAIKLGPITKSTLDIAENLTKINNIDKALRKEIRDIVYRDESDVQTMRDMVKKGKRKPEAIDKRINEMRRTEQRLSEGLPVSPGVAPNVTNYNAALQSRPDLLKKVKEFERSSGVNLVNENGELASAPIEQRVKPGEGHFQTLPKFGGFSRSLTQTYLDRMSAVERERFRSDVVFWMEKAFNEGLAPKTFDIALGNIKATPFNIAPALRGAKKTIGALNLNGMCPMFYVGSHGCYFDGCYVTGIGTGPMNVNVHDSAIYTGEILQLSDQAIKDLNSVGGLRLNGIGDTSKQDYGQWRDVMKHAAMRGLKLKVITKQEATFEIMNDLINDGDPKISFWAERTIIQPSLDPYWIPVEEDGRKGSFATEMGITGKPETAKAVISLYRQIGRDAKLINNMVYRKYGFSGEQLAELARKYPKVKTQPRVVVGTTKEIAEFALHQPEMLQTWMHAKVRPGMYSETHGRLLEEGEVGNFEDRIAIEKIDGVWRVQAQERKTGKVVDNKRYQAVEDYIKENYNEADQEKIFSTLAGSLDRTASALCCTSGASQDECNDCTSTCASGTYHTGTDLEALANRNTLMAKFQNAAKEAKIPAVDKASGTTQVGTTTGSYRTALKKALEINPNAKTVLDYGAGLGEGTQAMRDENKGLSVKSFEPNPERWTAKDKPDFVRVQDINETFDVVISPNVLNVVEPDVRNFIVNDIFDKLNPGGIALISTRAFKNDIDQTKNYRLGAEPKSYWIAKKQDGKPVEVYQKGFDGEELIDYLNNTVPEFENVRKGTGFGANGVIAIKPTSAIAEGEIVDSAASEEAKILSETPMFRGDTRPGRTQLSGVYFTSDRTDAESYGENLTEVRLDLKNPKVVMDANEITDWEFDTDALLKQGHDGIMHIASRETGYKNMPEGKRDITAVSFTGTTKKAFKPSAKDYILPSPETDGKGIVFIGADGMGADIEGKPSPDESFRYPDFHKAWTLSKGIATQIDKYAKQGYNHIAVVTYKHVRDSMKNHPHFKAALRRAMVAGPRPEPMSYGAKESSLTLMQSLKQPLRTFPVEQPST
jgi:SAM-dependent methyltransferase